MLKGLGIMGKENTNIKYMKDERPIQRCPEKILIFMPYLFQPYLFSSFEDK